MGSVYLAHDVRLMDRPCAIKLLHPSHLDDRYRDRFERESRIMARLHSPHIVDLLDVGITPQGHPFLVLEYMEGRPLSEAFGPSAPLSLAEALRIIEGILLGLSAAHDLGIIHRDLSLNNIFLVRSPDGPEHVKILDFGLAKDSTGLSGAALTQRGTALGTPTHMSPEQFRGEPIDHRADLYAAGIVLYRMLSGRPPFRADAEVPDAIAPLNPILRIGWQHVKRRPPRIEGLSDPLWAYIERLLAKERGRRFQTADEALAALPSAAAPELTPEPSAQAEAQPEPVTFEGDETRLEPTLMPAPRARARPVLLALFALSALAAGVLTLW